MHSWFFLLLDALKKKALTNKKTKKKKKKQRAVLFGFQLQMVIPALKHIKGREGLEPFGLLSIATRCFIFSFFFSPCLPGQIFLLPHFYYQIRRIRLTAHHILKRLGIGLRDETTL